MRYPGQIKAGEVSKRTFCSIDLMPTIAKLAGAKLPTNPIDGQERVGPDLGQAGARRIRIEYYAFSTARVFEGVISGDGRWKLHVPHEYAKLVEPGRDGKPGKTVQEKIDWSLFDMEGDPHETDQRDREVSGSRGPDEGIRRGAPGRVLRVSYMTLTVTAFEVCPSAEQAMEMAPRSDAGISTLIWSRPG